MIGKLKVCINFIDLNKTRPKGNYPLSQIDQLIDSMEKHELLNFLNVYSKYH